MSGQSHRFHLDQRFPPELSMRVWLGRLMVPLTYLVMGLPLLFLLLFIAALAVVSIFTPLRIAAPAVLFSLLGIVYSWLIVVRSSFAPVFLNPEPEAALLLDMTQEQELSVMVGRICVAMGTSLPDHVLLHMHPNLFVLKGRIALPDGDIVRGKILVVGFPLLDVLTCSELEAVLAHELAHFSGDDAVYSAFVHPAYVTLQEAIFSIERLLANKRQVFIKLVVAPQRRVFRWYRDKFRRNNLPVSRFREHRADLMAAIICGKNIYGAGLQKSMACMIQFGDLIRELEYGGEMPQEVFWYFRQGLGNVRAIASAASLKLTAVTREDDDHPGLSERLEFIRAASDKQVDARSSATILAGYQQYESKLNQMHLEVLAYKRKNHSLVYRDIVLQMQRPAGYTFPFASVWSRLGAVTTDLVLVGVLTLPVGHWLNEDAASGIFLGVWLIANIVLEGNFQQATPGKLLFRIKVAGYDSKPIGFLRAVKRNLFKLLCLLPGGAGGLQAVFDPNKQMVHDRRAKTIVIYSKVPKI